VWGHARRGAPRPTLRVTLEMLGFMIGVFGISVLAGAVRSHSTGFGVVASAVILVPYATLWLLISARLPHRDAAQWELVPGALLFAAGLEVLHVVTAYVIAPRADSLQSTYGALGVAAALFLGLFLISRLIVLAAVVNATLWERRSGDRAAAS